MNPADYVEYRFYLDNQNYLSQYVKQAECDAFEVRTTKALNKPGLFWLASDEFSKRPEVWISSSALKFMAKVPLNPVLAPAPENLEQQQKKEESRCEQSQCSIPASLDSAMQE